MISNTLHASEVYTTPIVTFEDTPDRQKIIAPIGFQILSQAELVEATGVEHVQEVINQPIIEG